MQIPLNAQVECSDGVFGHSLYVLINPVTDVLTHVIVQSEAAPRTEYMVPVECIARATDDRIFLNCTRAEAGKMDPFYKTIYVQETVTDNNMGWGGGGYGVGTTYYYLPYVARNVKVQYPAKEPRIPAGEMVIHRGASVQAKDGHIGRVDEFVIDPENNHITHLVMREGHLLGRRDIQIPVSAIEKTHSETVLLNLDKSQVEALPTFEIHRRWA